MKALAILISVLVTTLGMAAPQAPPKQPPKDAAYYQRTGTKPPGPGGDFLLGPSLHYSEQFSAGIAFGYQWKSTGVALVGDFSAMRVDPRAVASPSDCCPSCQFDGYTRGQVGVMLLVPIKKYAKAAK